MKLRLIDDVEEAREIHSLAFPADHWVGDEHTFWVYENRYNVLGFCSAVILPESNHLYLSRAAVIVQAQGKGLQAKMIRARLAWGIEHGCSLAKTYTSPKNYPSIVSLLKCGFRFYTPTDLSLGTRMHYLKKDL